MSRSLIVTDRAVEAADIWSGMVPRDQLREALENAAPHLADRATPRVWNEGDPEPAGLLVLVDARGDRWCPTGRGAWFGVETTAFPWDEIPADCWPMTEVLPHDEVTVR